MKRGLSTINDIGVTPKCDGGFRRKLIIVAAAKPAMLRHGRIEAFGAPSARLILVKRRSQRLAVASHQFRLLFGQREILDQALFCRLLIPGAIQLDRFQ